MKRYKLTKEQWERIKLLLPPEETGKRGRPRKDNRTMLNGMLWIVRSGAQWRELPETYGPWQSVYARFAKWRDDGTLEAVFHALSDDADMEALSVDSTCVKVHESANGGKKTADKAVDRTMLAGEVSQARMYQSKLTEAEVAAVADAPSAAGPKSDDLVLWLNFDPKNIVQTGTHTTEWAEISGAPASLAYKAEIPGKSAIQATVEFSKDGKTVSGSKAFDLKSGENTIDLTGAGEGKYVRIVTKFTSNLGTEQTDIPVLYTYTLEAGESTAAWNTYADWAKGTFADGAGHQSSDAYRALSEDFDDYAGEVDEGKPVEQTAASSETTQTGTAATTETTTETKPEQPKEAGWDVDDSHWAAKTIRAMMAEGVLEGDADGRIRPDDKITREEMIWVMNTMLGIKPKADTKLDAADRSSEWAYGALAAAKDAGILQGDEFGYLCGSDYATRAEIITMIARACKVSSDDRSVLAGFTDAADIPDWAVSALAGMAEQGSLSGYTDGTLQPNDQITRAEAFSLLYEAITVGEPAQAA